MWPPFPCLSDTFQIKARLEGNVCLTPTDVIVANTKQVLLLGDKQVRRDVYTMVYAIPSYLVYLLATKIALCYISPGLTFGWLLLKSYFHPCIEIYLKSHQ